MVDLYSDVGCRWASVGEVVEAWVTQGEAAGVEASDEGVVASAHGEELRE